MGGLFHENYFKMYKTPGTCPKLRFQSREHNIRDFETATSLLKGKRLEKPILKREELWTMVSSMSPE